MFLAIDPVSSYYVFTQSDPRNHGFIGEVLEGVTFNDGGDLLAWPEGQAAPEPTLGVSSDGKHYRAFKWPGECQKAGYTAVASLNFTGDYESWAEFQASWIGRRGKAK